jgi:hypothetical protein
MPLENVILQVKGQKLWLEIALAQAIQKNVLPE